MARKQYGTTTWGAALLRVLESKTDSGRLSRGKSYANTGRVYDVVVQDSHIAAKVEGNYNPYYSTSMDFRAFSKKEIESIKRILEEHPLVLASIMNGNLPETFLALLQEHNITLFENFSMQCTCPDFWGDYACKHIAGLYYIAVSEMDKNPFILFSLRSFDLVRTYGIENEINIAYPLILTPYTKEEVSSESFEMIKLKDNADFILSMLSENPPFAPIDYKEVMEEFYKKVPKAQVQNISPIQTTHIEDIERLFKNADFEFVLEHQIYATTFTVSNPLFLDATNLFTDWDVNIEKETLSISTQTLFRLFLSFEDDSGSQSCRFIFHLFRIAYMMIEAKAFVPAVIENGKSFLIVYRLLHAIPEVKQQLCLLSQLAPKMLQYENKYLDQRSTTEAILSATISDFVTNMSFMHKKQKNNLPKISSSFFKAKAFEIKGFEEENTASAVYNYFSIFDIIKSQYRYKVYIDKEETYFLEIKVQHEKKEYPLQKSLSILNKMEILKFSSFINTYLPQTAQLIECDKVLLSQVELETFLLETSRIMSNLGIDIILPKELKNLLRPKLSLKVSSTSKNLQSFFDLQSMLEYDWQIAIGNQTLSVEEFESLVASGKELIEFKDNFVVISAEVAKNIFAEIQSKKSLNHFDVLQATLSGEAFLTKELETYIDALLSPKEIPRI